MNTGDHNRETDPTKIEDLNKMQLLLLGILVSFVTSIATGIVTVTLMDQAPPGMTQTINRVIEKTVQVIAPESNNEVASVVQTVIVKEEDFIIEATDKNSANVVGVGTFSNVTFEKDLYNTAFTGTGFSIVRNGLIVTDKANIPEDSASLLIKNSEGKRYYGEVITVDHEHLALIKIGDLFVVDALNNEVESISFNKVIFAKENSARIGQTAIALGFDEGVTLSLGTISQLKIKEENLESISTTINTTSEYSGGPLLDTDGHLVGISIVSEKGGYSAIPADEIMVLLDMYEASVAEDSEEEIL